MSFALRHIAWVGVLIVPITSIAQDPTYQVLVTEINGADVAGGPTGSVMARPCDTLTIEVFLRDWSPANQNLRGYQLSFDASSFTSGTSGNIYPLNYADTTDLNGKCSADSGVDGTDNPTVAFIDSANCTQDGDPPGSDVGPWSADNPCVIDECGKGNTCGAPSINYIHDGQGPLTTINTLTCGYAYASALLGMGGPISDQDGNALYCASLQLAVSEDASGEFTLDLKLPSAQDAPGSFLLDAQGNEIEPLMVNAATIQIADAPIAIVASIPPDGAIDAGQPTDLDGTNPAGWDEVTLIFDGGVCSIDIAEFVITSNPAGLEPEITDIAVDGAAVTLLLDGPISPGARTTFTHAPSDTAVCLGFLPADSSGDANAAPLDILTLIDGLNGVLDPPLAPWQADINRSGQSEPLDILALIDLLNGAEAFDVWNGVSLPDCGEGGGGGNTVDIEVGPGFDFVSADVMIEVGDTVRWTWIGGLHNVESGVSGAHDGIFRSGDPITSDGMTFEVTFDEAFLAANPVTDNEYPYFCAVHFALGMTGSVTVQE
jgi:plastocyanin